MKEIKNDIVRKYQYIYNNNGVNENYVIYIKETENGYGFYLQNEDYCIIDFMVGLSKEQLSIEYAIEIVSDSLADYVEEYKKEFED